MSFQDQMSYANVLLVKHVIDVQLVGRDAAQVSRFVIEHVDQAHGSQGWRQPDVLLQPESRQPDVDHFIL